MSLERFTVRNIEIEFRNWSQMVDIFTEENMKTLIKEIFQEKFNKQAENITHLISGNFKLTMQEMGRKMKSMTKEKTLILCKNNLEEKINNVQKIMEKLNSDIQEIYKYQIDLNYVQDKLTVLEDRSHLNNIRIDWTKETKGEV